MAHGPIRQEYAYDLDKNLTGLTVRSGEALLSHASYAYDGNGNRIRKQALDGTTLYQYDALGQLQRVDYPAYSEELFYDKAGNRARRLVGGEEELYQYDPRNRLMALTRGGVTTPFQYDNAGNLLRDDKARYSYDAFNRTVKVESFDGNVQVNRYDAEGLRHEMEENGRLVRFIFHKGEAVVEHEENSNVIRLIRGSELIARSSDSESARTYYHYASDEMGSTTHIVDESGNVQNRYAYDAWGRIEVKEEAVPNRFTYYGQQIDPITQQYYLRARFYNPVIGRFTQEDTYRGDGLNLYAYCANNPVYYVDPSGFASDKLWPNELASGTYKQLLDLLENATKSHLTPHHTPADLYMRTNYGISKPFGWAISLETTYLNPGGRHGKTATYGGNFSGDFKKWYLSLSPRDALAFDIRNIQNILKEQGLYDSNARRLLREHIHNVVNARFTSDPDIVSRPDFSGKKVENAAIFSKDYQDYKPKDCVLNEFKCPKKG